MMQVGLKKCRPICLLCLQTAAISLLYRKPCYRLMIIPKSLLWRPVHGKHWLPGSHIFLHCITESIIKCIYVGRFDCNEINLSCVLILNITQYYMQSQYPYKASPYFRSTYHKDIQSLLYVHFRNYRLSNYLFKIKYFVLPYSINIASVISKSYTIFLWTTFRQSKC